ncbi:MAG: hypothetical protein IPK01_13105 [Acidobacteria bacterium]|nr:hypothetical protein [Acidobacteriota bacterium]
MLTIIVGNVAAIMQSSVKRMLAYSSIAHAGYARRICRCRPLNDHRTA